VSQRVGQQFPPPAKVLATRDYTRIKKNSFRKLFLLFLSHVTDWSIEDGRNAQIFINMWNVIDCSKKLS